MAATTAAPSLTNEQVVEALGLMKGADSVELKLTVPADSQRTALKALDIDPLDAQIRQVFFFDTPDLALYAQRRGRARAARPGEGRRHRRQAPPGRPARAARRAPPLLELRGRGRRDAGRVRLLRLVQGRPPRAAREGVRRRRPPVRKLFSKEQRAFYAEHAPEGIALDDLTVLGPIFVLKVKFSPKALGRKVVAELWLYPDDSRLLELSTKCEPAEAFQVSAETRAFLTERGIDMSGEQETKTRKALEFFAAQLAAGDSKA